MSIIADGLKAFWNVFAGCASGRIFGAGASGTRPVGSQSYFRRRSRAHHVKCIFASAQIEKVGQTYFLNIFRTVVSYSHLAIVIGFRLVVVNSRMIAVCENLGMCNVIRN